jgi:transposase
MTPTTPGAPSGPSVTDPKHPADLSTLCMACGDPMRPEHAHYRCPSCGWRDSCCDGPY